MIKPKNLLLWLSVATAALGASALTDRQVRDEIAATPEKGGGIYYAYPYSTDSLNKVPAGYEPFYISHYGRHGSRWVINKTVHEGLINDLLAQECENNLTDTGPS